MENNCQHSENTGDDSDTDVVTDFLNSNCENLSNESIQNTKNYQPIPTVSAVAATTTPLIAASNTVSTVTPTNNNMNTIPIINVTPHSPASGSKYNNIFEDTLSQLQNIRETVVQMKNSSGYVQEGLSNCGLINAAILSASLPDLTVSNPDGTVLPGTNMALMWSPQQQQYLLNADRRKSWTAIDDLNAGQDGVKSISLSSLDSEEQETIRVTEQRRRSARNSTGGELYKFYHFFSLSINFLIKDKKESYDFLYNNNSVQT